METPITAEQVVDIVWESFRSLRVPFTLRGLRHNMIYLIYGYHRQYPYLQEGVLGYRYIAEGDKLLNDLYYYIKNESLTPNLRMENAYDELSKVPHDEFEKVYPDILIRLNDTFSKSYSYSETFSHKINKNNDFTPSTVTSLIAYFVNKENCKSVYDPFCGTALIVHKLQDGITFTGQDVSIGTSLIARVNMEARYNCDKGIVCHDSIYEWPKDHFDAIVSCPPFGLRLPQVTKGDEKIRSVEELIINKWLAANGKICALILPFSFTFSNTALRIRQLLIENNYLDTVILLPSNSLYNTSTKCLLLVCKSNRKPNEPVKIFYAEKYTISNDENKNDELDVKRFIQMLESAGKKDCINVMPDKIRDLNYNLIPSLFTGNDHKIHEGQRTIRFCDVLDRAAKSNDDNSVRFLPLQNFSNKYIDIILNKNKLTEKPQNKNTYIYNTFHCNKNKSYLLVARYMTSVFKCALHTSGEDFKCAANVQVFEINEDIVIPEYLIYCLTNEAFCGDLMSVMSIPFVIDCKEKQREIIKKLNDDYLKQRDAEIEAERLRLGFKKPISDIEHMLGATMLRIENSITRIGRSAPENDTYQRSVKSLISNVRYMIRIIKYTNAKIEKESLKIEDGDICAFIREYEENWRNYGDKYFSLFVNIDMEGCPKMSFDKTMLTVMLDSILDNASRHGFHKRWSENNRACISLSLTMYEDDFYLLIRVCNNGDPIQEGFTIDDYVSRGRYTEGSGRSGLGGSHVYEIAKGHGGHLCLDSNQIWNVIIDVLLPVNEFNGNKDYITIYENEDKCI